MKQLLLFAMKIGATGFFGMVFKDIICLNAYQFRGYEAVGGEYLAVIIFFIIFYVGVGKIIDGIFVVED